MGWSSQASLSFTVSQSLFRLVSIESVMPSNHLVLCRSLLLLPSIVPSTRVFSNELALCIRWPKYWSFSISPSKEYRGLVSFRMHWLDLLAVQGTLRSLLQHHSLQAPVLWLSAFFIVRLSHRYMTTGKTIALTIWTFVGKVISLLFHTLSRLVTILTLSKLPSQPGYQPSQPPYLIIAPYLNGLNWVEDSSLSGWLTLKLFLEVKFIPREDTLANHSGCRV